jgi:hypothetical protein
MISIMTTKLALLNATLFNPNYGTFEKTNLLLINQKIVGIGYIPDDDNSTQIDLAGHYIFPNIFNPVIQENILDHQLAHVIQDRLIHQGITATGVISHQEDECKGKHLYHCVSKTDGVHVFPIHQREPESSNMLGLWVTDQTDIDAIEKTIRFNRLLLSQWTIFSKDATTKYPAASWLLFVNTLSELDQLLAVKRLSFSVSIASHLITQTNHQTLIEWVKSNRISCIHIGADSKHSILAPFPLLYSALDISTIHALFSTNLLCKYSLKLKHVAIGHTPNLTIFEPKTGHINAVVLNGHYHPLKR